MRKSSKALIIAGVMIFALLAITACDQTADSAEKSKDRTVVAAVDGIEILKSAIEEEESRAMSGMGLTDTAEFEEFLTSLDQTIESYRLSVLEYLVRTQILKKSAADLGVSVSEAELESNISMARDSYPDAASWEQALEASGFTSESYKETIRLSLLADGVRESISAETQLVQEDIQQFLDENYEALAGKRSSHILMNAEDAEAAQSIFEKIMSGELNFTEAAEEYSLDGSGVSGGDVGWDSMATFVQEYQVALDDLEYGQVCEPVVSQFGVHIIKCTDVYKPEVVDGHVDIGSVPLDLMEAVYSLAASEKSQSMFLDHLDEVMRSSEIIVYDEKGEVLEDPFGLEEL